LVNFKMFLDIVISTKQERNVATELGGKIAHKDLSCTYFQEQLKGGNLF